MQAIATLDFESYFGADYTLSKMTTEEYVRDNRFKAHCVGFKPMGKPVEMYNPNRPRDLELLRERCATHALIAQKAQFDGLILSHWFGIIPPFWFDTLSMARLVLPNLRRHSLAALAKHLQLEEKSVPYDSFKDIRDIEAVPGLYNAVAIGCAQDCELTEQVFLKLIGSVPKEELELIDLTVRMFTEPTLTLDTARMQRFHEHLQREKQNLLTQLGVTAKDVASDDKFAAILRHIGVEPETKVTAKGNTKFAFAKTDDFMRQLEDHEVPHVALLAECRLDIKSTGAETRAKRMLDMDLRGRMCVYLNFSGATNTTRWSGGDKMNWQNFTRIDFDDQGNMLEFPNQRGEIRLSVTAPQGYYVMVADSSQIECRVLNRVAGQNDVLQKFANRQDIYSELASQFYNFEVTKKNKAERGTGKQLELSCGYGAGAATIVNTAKLGIYGPPVMLSPDQGLAARNLYRNTHREVVALWKEAGEVVLPYLLNRQHYVFRDIMNVYDGRIWMPNGTFLDYTGLAWDHDEREWTVETKKGKGRIYGAHLIENIIQKLARDIVAQAALRIKPYMRLVNLTHDEVIGLAPIEQAPELHAFMIDEMKRPVAWLPNLPLDAEGGYAKNYSK